MSGIWKFMDHNRYGVGAIILGAVVLWLSVGCQSTTPSPLDGDPVPYSGLNADYRIETAEMTAAIERKNAEYEAAYADLEEQDRVKAAIVNTLEPVVGPALASYGIGGAGILGILGIGADNRRKDRVIKKMKMADEAA